MQKLSNTIIATQEEPSAPPQIEPAQSNRTINEKMNMDLSSSLEYPHPAAPTNQLMKNMYVPAKPQNNQIELSAYLMPSSPPTAAAALPTHIQLNLAAGTAN